MYMSMVNQKGIWVTNCVSGYGWLAIALVIFSNMESAPRHLFVDHLRRIVSDVHARSDSRYADGYLYDVPYIATILVLILTSIRQIKDTAQPASTGLNYYREER